MYLYARRTTQGVRGLKPTIEWDDVEIECRTSQGVRGLKQIEYWDKHSDIGRTSQGVRGLKLCTSAKQVLCRWSHLAGGAWIETVHISPFLAHRTSHLAGGAWIENVHL